MRWTWRDTVATALVAMVVAMYVGYLAGTDAPLIDDTRGTAALTLVLGWASRVIGGHGGFPRGPIARIARLGNFGSIGLGIVATATESPVVLGASIVSIVSLWILGASYGHRPHDRRMLRGVH